MLQLSAAEEAVSVARSISRCSSRRSLPYQEGAPTVTFISQESESSTTTEAETPGRYSVYWLYWYKSTDTDAALSPHPQQR